MPIPGWTTPNVARGSAMVAVTLPVVDTNTKLGAPVRTAREPFGRSTGARTAGDEPSDVRPTSEPSLEMRMSSGLVSATVKLPSGWTTGL
jgi:hypothetical protein